MSIMVMPPSAPIPTPNMRGMSGASIFARQCVAELSAGGIVASSEVLYGITNAQYIHFEEEL